MSLSHRSRHLPILLTSLLWLATPPPETAHAQPNVSNTPPEATPEAPPEATPEATLTPAQTTHPIMTVDQVRIGMTGYGLTVFAGTEIEPFAVEVIAVVPNSTAGRSTIWIRCHDPRLEISGPVQGMSGSPIYLWDQDTGGTIGQGGRLIGAFAFGHAMVKVCMAGVQPIEYMLETGRRAPAPGSFPRATGSAPRSFPHATDPGSSPRATDRIRHRAIDPQAGLRMLDGLAQYADTQHVPAAERVLLDWTRTALRQAAGEPTRRVIPGVIPGVMPGTLFTETSQGTSYGTSTTFDHTGPTAGVATSGGATSGGATSGVTTSGGTTFGGTTSGGTISGNIMSGGAGNTSGGQAMLLPMGVGSDAMAGCLAPLFEPMGIAPMAGTMVGGKPAPSIDIDTPLAPGSVLAVPLAFGDLDLSASGTVTEILTDGTVLGFGHAMFGMGPTAVPMASGYVQFVVPRITTSFKQASSLKILGSIVQDEAAAVAGVAGKAYTTAPLNITVTLPGQAPRPYHFEVVNHPMLTAPVVAAVIGQTLGAVYAPPIKSMVHLSGHLTFSGGRTLLLDRGLIGMNAEAAVYEITPLMIAMALNPFEELELESIALDVTVTDGLALATLESAQLDRPTAAPGDTVHVQVAYRPYGQPSQTLSIPLALPLHLPDGEYPLMISDATMYAMRAMDTRPYLATVDSIDDLFETLTDGLKIRHDRLYTTLTLDTQDLAIGRQPMPDLPSSRAVLLATPGRTDVTPYPRTLETTTDAPMLMQGELMLPITVRSPDAPAP